MTPPVIYKNCEVTQLENFYKCQDVTDAAKPMWTTLYTAPPKKDAEPVILFTKPMFDKYNIDPKITYCSALMKSRAKKACDLKDLRFEKNEWARLNEEQDDALQSIIDRLNTIAHPSNSQNYKIIFDGNRLSIGKQGTEILGVDLFANKRIRVTSNKNEVFFGPPRSEIIISKLLSVAADKE